MLPGSIIAAAPSVLVILHRVICGRLSYTFSGSSMAVVCTFHHVTSVVEPYLISKSALLTPSLVSVSYGAKVAPSIEKSHLNATFVSKYFIFSNIVPHTEPLPEAPVFCLFRVQVVLQQRLPLMDDRYTHDD